jgi:hypothetical protein
MHVSSIILETCNILRWNTSSCWSWQASACLEKGWRNLATWMCWFEGWSPCSSDVLGTTTCVSSENITFPI